MANDLLRQAMATARMTVRDLAAAVEVDEKTVGRWVTAARVPHPRHRWAAAEVLGVGEDVLWPEAARSAIKVGADREIVAVYPYRSGVPKSLWRDLVTGAETKIVFAGYTNYFLWLEIPNLRAALARKSAKGVQVRVIVGDPDSEITRERERVEAAALTVSTRIAVTLDEVSKLRALAPEVEARFSDRHIASSVFVFDDQMIVSYHLADLLGHDSPTFHVRRRGDDGLYDRFSRHVAWLWDGGRPT